MRPDIPQLPYVAETTASVRRTPCQPAQRWMEHIVGAEFLWLSRLTGRPSPLDVWPELDLNACAARVEELDSESLTDAVAYRNTNGEVWSSTVADILTHVTIHSGYHRGQIE
jgi:uncharacterized damage-inducible protein DinB